MDIAILVKSSPYTSQAAGSAYHFCLAALAKGHNIVQVFFYQDGVYNVAKLHSTLRYDRNLPIKWEDLARAHHIDLAACVTAVKKRGMEPYEGEDVEPECPHGVFRITGLGQLFEAIEKAQRCVEFC